MGYLLMSRPLGPLCNKVSLDVSVDRERFVSNTQSDQVTIKII